MPGRGKNAEGSRQMARVVKSWPRGGASLDEAIGRPVSLEGWRGLVTLGERRSGVAGVDLDDLVAHRTEYAEQLLLLGLWDVELGGR